jgi:hypothetical protein
VTWLKYLMEEKTMSIEVTLNVFSGRPNPSWKLSDDQEKELLAKLEAIDKPSLQKPPGVIGGLGYRGFIVSRPPTHPAGTLSLLVHEGVVDLGQHEESRVADNRDLESWLLATTPSPLDAEVTTHVAAQLSGARLNVADHFSARIVPVHCPVCHAHDAPVYNPGMWNVPSVQPHNNCYNYANNQITNTFAQPGRAHGQQTNIMDCPHVQHAAQADGLLPVPNFTAPLAAGHGWYVALVIWPGVDYHWYRQDKGGCWSHKPGGTAARNTDNSGHLITDPRSCNRGPYINFCTFMVTRHGLVIR